MMEARTFEIISKSSSVNSPACTLDAIRIFSFTISNEFMPDKTHVTCGSEEGLSCLAVMTKDAMNTHGHSCQLLGK